MSIVNKVNKKMRDDTIVYTKELNLLSKKLISKLNSTNLIPDFNLNSREKEILLFVAEGYKNKEIAEELYISVNTVKYHIKKLYDKMHIKTREEARLKAKQSIN